MDGLAASMTGPTTPPQEQSAMGMSGMPSIEEVIALLMQGIDPAKIEEMGVPPEIIMQAIEVLEQQMAVEQQQQQQVAAQQGGGGLAQQMVGG